MYNIGSLYAVATAVLFATFGIFAKFIYVYGISSETIFLSSNIISAIFMLFVLLIKEKNLHSLKIKKNDFILSFIIAGFLALFCCNIAVLKALNYIEAGVQKFICYTNPLFTTFIYFTFLKKKISEREWVSLSIMLVGLIFIISRMNFTTPSAIKGIILSILAAIFSSIYSIIIEENKTKMNYIAYWFYAYLGASVFVLIYMLFNNININIMNVIGNFKLILLIISSAILNFAVPYMTQFLAINSIGAIKTGIIAMLSPVLCVLLSVVMLGESITYIQIIGMILIVIASITISGKSKK